MHHTTSNPPLPWIFDPVLIGMLVTAAVIYVLLAGPLRSRLTSDGRVTRAQAIMFASGLLLAFLGESSPLHEMSDRYLFSAHMVQHLLLSYAVAPLILAGTPGWMMRPFLVNRVVEPVFRVLTKPVVALVVFSLGFSLWHLPFVYEAALHSDFVHHTQHVVYLVLAFIMWWPVMSPLPELPRLNPGTQILYLAGLPVGQFFAGALVTFTAVSIYPTYEAAPRLFGLSVIDDQTLGGVIMKVGSFVTYGIPLIVVFLRWAAKEGRPGTAGPATEAPGP